MKTKKAGFYRCSSWKSHDTFDVDLSEVSVTDDGKFKGTVKLNLYKYGWCEYPGIHDAEDFRSFGVQLVIE